MRIFFSQVTQCSTNKQISSTMLYFAFVFSIFVQMAHSRSTMQTFPVASPIQRLTSAATDINALGPTQLSTVRQKLSIETNSIQRHMVEVTSSSAVRSHSRSLKRVALSNRNITCNDGSQAGFYLRKNPNSKKWIVFLEGGWHCYDTKSCKARWLRLRHLMTSAQWPETRDVGGILSPLPDENPYWHNANHVLVPYCSSDSWSGTRAEPESKDSWRFMGALILRQVIADLIPLGLERPNGAELLLVGSSAGGLGVMLNLDRIANYLLHERNLLVTVRGISDSGWFLDREPYTPSAVASSDAVRQGWKLWQGLLPEDCTKKHNAEPWRCYFGYRLYPTLKSPLFVFQWLFDEAQMRADNVGAPVTPQQWNYIHEMGGALRSSLDNVTAVFAPSCIGHAVLSKRDWVNIKIDDISLPAALRCWEHSTRPRRKRHNKLKRATEPSIFATSRRHHRKHAPKQHSEQSKENIIGNVIGNNGNAMQTNNHSRANRPRLTKEQREERKRRRHERQQRQRENRYRRNRKRHPNSDATATSEVNNETSNNTHPENETALQDRKHRNRQRNNSSDESNSNINFKPHHHNGKRRRKQKKQHQQYQHEQHHTVNENNNNSSRTHEQDLFEQQFEKERLTDEPELRKHRNNNAKNKRANLVPRVPERCVLRLLERCSWPQCNHSCPTLTNPLTGEEMRFLELLTSFGLDIEAVAAALGVDMHTLNNMDRTELVNLLTQQVRTLDVVTLPGYKSAMSSLV